MRYSRIAKKMKPVKHILVVDDDYDILMSIQIILESEGYHVDTDSFGEKVETIITKERPDLILMDMYLSGNDGRKITSFLKSQSKTEHIPIIMMSAHPYAARDAWRVGSDDFIAKPFDIANLLNKVKIHISV